MAVEHQTNLVAGCDWMSRHLKYCLSPTSLLFEFDQNPPNRPKPLPLAAILYMSVWIFILFVSDSLGTSGDPSKHDGINEVYLAQQSPFVLTVLKIFRIYRLVTHTMTLIMALRHHGPLANVIASNDVFVSEKDQVKLARRTFIVFFVRALSRCTSYMAIFIFVFSHSDPSNYWRLYGLAMFVLGLLALNMSLTTPLMHTNYIGAAFGRHVKNFSEIYVDSLFDQFMKAIEMEDQSYEEEDDEAQVPEFIANADPSQHPSSFRWLRYFWKGLVKIFKVIGIIILGTRRFLRAFFARLYMRHYPELPEMKMAKLSTTKNIQISERMRLANNDLIRLRLRRTQIMLCDLRDKVNDVNRLSSPLSLVYLLYDTVTIVLITTASIQAKVYRSLNLLLLPTIVYTVGLGMSVTYFCNCMDDTGKELKLMINKLFDFIIMNHRVKSSDKKSKTTNFLVDPNQIDSIRPDGRDSNCSDRNNSISIDYTNNSSLVNNETSDISETWSQFQYTRKLANTIQFTMGGIVPVTRRLVLSILGHILSAAFISIEIMSIIDTSPDISHPTVPRNITSVLTSH